MAIKSLKIRNVMTFQRQWKNNSTSYEEEHLQSGERTCGVFQLDFTDGINIIIGENGVGKTTILKMIYAATQWSIEKTDVGKTKQFVHFFSSNLSNADLLKTHGHQEEYSYFEVSDGEHTFVDSLSHNGFMHYEEWLGLNIQSVFIPTTEMLSHSKGFLALNQKYKLPFDGTQVDIIVNASLPETRELPENMQSILKKISQVIDGEVIMEDDTFYVLKSDGRKVDFSLEAEGLRKLGLLWKLIRNGLLEKGTILLWDEPEANLNPEMLPLVVDILLELEATGVQIFIATHSYNLAKYFEIRRIEKTQVEFHNLYWEPSDAGGQNRDKRAVYGTSAFYLEELKNNKIIQADEKLLDEALEKNL